mgnify:CR=1 FL=1
MAKGREYISVYPDNYPQWYWTDGLHDACIVDVIEYELPFDYKKYKGDKSKYDRNILTLKISTKAVLYDKTVKEIRFFNYKTLSADIPLKCFGKAWWMSDRLAECGDYYVLEIVLSAPDLEQEEFTFKIKFERAEVDRK